MPSGKLIGSAIAVVLLTAIYFVFLYPQSNASLSSNLTSKLQQSQLAIQLTDPPQVPAGTQALIITYSGVQVHAPSVTGSGWLSGSGSGSLDLLSLVNLTQTIASANVPANVSVDMVRFNVTSAVIKINNTISNVTLSAKMLTAKVYGSKSVNGSTSSVVIQLSPTVATIFTNTSTVFVMVPSLKAVVVPRANSTSLRVGVNVKLDSVVKQQFIQIVPNISITSASLKVAPSGVTHLSLTVQNNYNKSVFLQRIGVFGNESVQLNSTAVQNQVQLLLNNITSHIQSSGYCTQAASTQSVNVCPGGSSFNSTTNGCSCPSGQQFNSHHVCQQLQITTGTCPGGSVFNPQTNSCSCPVGFLFDSRNVCVYSGIPSLNSSSQRSVNPPNTIVTTTIPKTSSTTTVPQNAITTTIPSNTITTTIPTNSSAILYISANPSNGFAAISPAPGPHYFPSNTQVTLSESASSGYVFTGWIGSGSGSYTGNLPSVTITVSGQVGEAANYAPANSPSTAGGSQNTSTTSIIQYPVSISVSPAGSGATSPSGTHYYSSGLSLTMGEAAIGNYVFVGWIGSGSGSYTGNTPTPTITVSNAISEVAYFALPSSAGTHVPPIQQQAATGTQFQCTSSSDSLSCTTQFSGGQGKCVYSFASGIFSCTSSFGQSIQSKCTFSNNLLSCQDSGFNCNYQQSTGTLSCLSAYASASGVTSTASGSTSTPSAGTSTTQFGSDLASAVKSAASSGRFSTGTTIQINSTLCTPAGISAFRQQLTNQMQSAAARTRDEQGHQGLLMFSINADQTLSIPRSQAQFTSSGITLQPGQSITLSYDGLFSISQAGFTFSPIAGTIYKVGAESQEGARGFLNVTAASSSS
ncbi:MAG: hypothetical protein KGH53_01500 [Candidatus Micrarchaeota archaeon]|nr:hypothetical protein [Candidatus Micrarchaeota archaeon]